MSDNKLYFKFKKRTLKIYDFFPFTLIFLFPKINLAFLFLFYNKGKILTYVKKIEEPLSMHNARV